MKYEYKEIRKIRASALRQLCIQENWYTAGDNNEYGHLLFDLAENKANMTTADIIEIAQDIMKHSELDLDCTVESIASKIAQIADVFFEETKQAQEMTLLRLVEEFNCYSQLVALNCAQKEEGECDNGTLQWIRGYLCCIEGHLKALAEAQGVNLVWECGEHSFGFGDWKRQLTYTTVRLNA